MSLVLQAAVLAVLKDIDQLLRLYGQLTESDVPPRVQNLFARIRHIKAPHGSLVVLEETLKRRGRISFLFDHHLIAFKKFQDQLLDLELLLDPEQAMPRSGPGSEAIDVLPWMGPSGDQVDIFLEGFEKRIEQLENTCRVVLSELEESMNRSQIKTPTPAPTPSLLSVSAPNQQSMLAPVSPNLLGPMMQPPFGQLPIPMTSPLISPFSYPVHGSPFQNISPLHSPMQSPYIHPANQLQLPPVASLFNLAELPPIDLSASRTLGHLPSSTSSSLSLRPILRQADKKKKSKTVAERRVQELINAQYGNVVAAGVKRKRNLQDHALSTGIPQHVSERSLITRTPPPTYEAPPSPKLGPLYPPDDVAGPADDNITSSVWSSLDDLVDALPPQHGNQLIKGKGKQRVEFDTDAHWETASSIHTGSTAGTNSSSADSIREGSIFSTASRERTYDDGTCTMLVKATNYPHPHGAHGSGAGGKAVPYPVTHLEVKRTAQGGIIIVSRTTNGQEMADNLFMTRLNENAKPFLEHSDVVEAMKMSIARMSNSGKSPQIRGMDPRGKYPGDDTDMELNYTNPGPKIAAIVFFAPNPSHHPQYAFSTHQDAWDFVSATSSSPCDMHMDPDWTSHLSLVCSASVTSIKSALTHGNVEESGLVTVQVWERDTTLSAPKPPSTGVSIGHRQDSLRQGNSVKNTDRFVRLFRNKSPLANAPVPPATASSAAGRTASLNIHISAIVLDVDCKFLKPPEMERRTGKVTFAFRDLGSSAGPVQQGLSGVMRGMKYLKVAFRDEDEKREFLHEAGFGG